MADSKISFLDYKIDSWDWDKTIDSIKSVIALRTPTQHCVLNAYKVYLAEKDEKLKEIIKQCGMLQADGISIVWAGKILGLPNIPRITGVDLMTRLLDVSGLSGYRIFFLGGSDFVLEKIKTLLKTKYPNVTPAGFQNGYFSESEANKVVEKINGSHADILFVGISSPKKEYWLADNLKRINTPFCMGVGGSFDVLAGKAKRAPRWIQIIGMEWLYRWIQEPIRLSRRYIIGNSVFGYLIMRAFFRNFKGIQKCL